MPAAARFCPSCGAALISTAPVPRPPAAPERERKQITAMFVDIVSSMDLAGQVGDELWRDVLDAFFAAAGAAVHAVEGTVHQFTGDGVMALFGAPLSHEDHARRACLAALDLHGRVAALAADLATECVELAVRVGLHSGEVIVGLIGDELHMGWAAIGHTTGVAKRMESLAPAGATVLSAATASLVAGEFELAELGTFPVKGMRDAQRVVTLGQRRDGVLGRVDAALAGGTLTPMVGRAPELRVLSDALERIREGDGQAVAVVGEPGVGKSRLVAEFAGRCARGGVEVHRVVAEPHGRALSLRPVLVLLRSVFGIGPGDDDATARARVQHLLDGLEPGPPGDLALVLDLLGVPDPQHPAPQLDPDGRQRGLLGFVARLVRARARVVPIVLICEDLHWFDDASRGFVAELVRAAAGTRALLLATTRPEREPVEITGPHAHRVTLDPLDPAATGTLLASLLGPDRSLDGLGALVAERAGGNPFFCEELVAALRETGHLAGAPGAHRLATTIDDLVLPATVQATLSARMDRLGAGAKRLLHDAAVIGTEFDAALLAELAGSDLAALAPGLGVLVAAEMIIEMEVVGRFTFRHPLTREVAYHAQLGGQRRAAHARLAEAVTRLHPDGLDEQAGLVALHWEAADHPAEAARWHTRAARWAERTSPHMGMSHWETARRLADAAGDTADGTRLGIEARVGILNQSWRVGVALGDLRAVHQEGLDLLAGQEGAPALRLVLDWGLYANLIFTGHERTGYPVGIANVALAEDIGDRALLVTTTAGSCYGAFLVGRIQEAIDIADRGLAVADGDVTLGAGLLMANPYAHCLLIRAVCTCLAGDVPAAGRDLREALAIAQEHDAPEMATYAHWGLALVHTSSGEPADALREALAAQDIAERAGNAWGQTMAQQAVAWAHLGSGDLAAAERACGRGLALIESSGIGHHYDPVLRTALATAWLLGGRVADAVTEATAAAGTARERGLSWAEVPARLAQAHALLAGGHTEQAAAAAARGATQARTSGVRLYDKALSSVARRAGALRSHNAM